MGTSVKRHSGNKKLRDLGCAAILSIPAVSGLRSTSFLADQNGAQKFLQGSSPCPENATHLHKAVFPGGEQKSHA
jgi:hypothetical protein